MWERHELLENTIGVLPDEELSYVNVTTIFYVVVGLIPTLTLMEMVLYCLYQCKVSKNTAENIFNIIYNFQFHPWKEIVAKDKIKEDEEGEEVNIKWRVCHFASVDLSDVGSIRCKEQLI